MATTFKFYHDSSLTQPVEAGTPITATQASDDSIAAVDKQLWFGSTTSSVKAQATSDPGTDPITITPTDSAGGSGLPNTTLKLATTQGGLTAATAGAALSIAATVNSGSANAVTLWVRIDTGTPAAGAYTDLSLVTNDLTESAV